MITKLRQLFLDSHLPSLLGFKELFDFTLISKEVKQGIEVIGSNRGLFPPL
jgi:hypothetical protein